MSVPPLRTARLRLEPLDPARHAVALHELYAAPEFAAHLASGAPATAGDKADDLRVFEGLPPGLGGWVAHLADGSDDPGRVVGRFSLRPWKHAGPTDPPEVGWFLAVDQWGRGLAAEGMRAVLRYAAWQLHVPSVLALVRHDNDRSRALARRLGGVVTGQGSWYGSEPSLRYDLALPVVREGGPADRDAVMDLWARAARRPDGRPAPELGEAAADGKLAHGIRRLAHLGGTLVGSAIGQQAVQGIGVGDAAPVPGLLHVSTVATDPAREGWGIGTALLADVLDRGRAQGFDRAQLWVLEDNPRARGIYERFGFTVTPEHTRVDEAGDRVLRYERRL
ncbi:GNAT family N-acetyltransferase [Oryzihumus sp.]|uniref:GNAT family N-acetyltransferase n=1 Tax=Oryzihumus sp. TaxID=1968903 RepID=UPI002ED9F522